MSKFERRVVSQDAERGIIDRYLSGQNVPKIAADLGLNTGNVTYTLIRNGVPRRRAADSNRRHSLDESVFDSVTSDSAYWIGMLMADGNINDTRKGWQLRLTLSGEDGTHVASFREFLRSSHPLRKIQPHVMGRYTCRPATSLSISSSRLAQALSAYGVVPRKSLTAKVVGLEGNRDFWRGVIDGDGSVGYRTGPYGVYALLELVGSLSLTSQFCSFVEAITGRKFNRHSHDNKIAQVTLTGRYALPVIRAIYADCGPALPRKKATADRLMALCDANGKLPR